jgi:DNA-directed RNA polymerase subunit N (RpoN/RPB10)
VLLTDLVKASVHQKVFVSRLHSQYGMWHLLSLGVHGVQPALCITCCYAIIVLYSNDAASQYDTKIADASNNQFALLGAYLQDLASIKMYCCNRMLHTPSIPDLCHANFDAKHATALSSWVIGFRL